MTSKPIQRGICSCLLLMLGLSATASAAPDQTAAAAGPAWYDVEIIVFRLADATAASSETWPPEPGIPDLAHAVIPIPANSAAKTTQAFQLLPASGEKLTGAWQRLTRSGRYEPLVHLAWTQPAEPTGKAKSVRIELSPDGSLVTTAVARPADGNIPVRAGNRQPQNTAPSASNPPQVMPENPGALQSAATSPITLPPLAGIVTLSQDRYLHLGVDLVLTRLVAAMSAAQSGGMQTALPAERTASEPAGPSSQTQRSPGYQSFRLTQNRRVSAGDINYFDHPMFGVLALVTPRPMPAAVLPAAVPGTPAQP